MARQRCGPAAGRSIAAGGSGRVWVAALRHLDGAIRSITPPRRRDTRLPEPCSWKTDAAIAPVASVAAFLIFTSRACGQASRQALAGSTLRSSARGRRGPPPVARNGRRGMSSLGIDPEPEQHHLAERRASQRARAAGVAASRVGAPVPRAQPEPPSLAASHGSGLVGQLSGPGSGGAARSTARHQRVAKQSRNAQHPARDTWLPRQTPPT